MIEPDDKTHNRYTVAGEHAVYTCSTLVQVGTA